MSNEKVRENRLRRMANRQGLGLQKCRARDPRALGYGSYRLIDLNLNAVIYHDPCSGYGRDLDDVEGYLSK